MNTTRRDFLKRTIGSSAFFSLSATAPSFFARSTVAAAARSRGENVLVIVELAGGNDGINTVIPHGDDAYHRSRNATRYAPNSVLKIDDYHGLHPQMSALKGLYDDGHMGIVQGVGYPNPNRSHFESMDIWHTARPTGEGRVAGRDTGWVGRYLDATRSARDVTGDDVPALHLGVNRQPLALAADTTRIPTISDVNAFKLKTRNDVSLRRTIQITARVERSQQDDLLQYIQRSTVNALASSDRVQDALRQYHTPIQYPTTTLGNQLRTVAQLIEADMSTRVYYVTHGGFDTHANQRNAHAALLKQYSDAVAAFTNDMAHHGHGERVMVMTFSEFGRRVKENASAGTDHGAAGPMFIVGGKARGGLIGKHPSMTRLDQGDLFYHTDFRAVYATLLSRWLGVPAAGAQAIMGGAFDPVNVVA